MSRAFLAAGALLASAALAQAGDTATFSPDLKPSPLTSASTPAPVAAAEAPPAGRGKAGRRRTRLAKARAGRASALAAAQEAAPGPVAGGHGAKPLTIGSIPAPLPPVQDDKVSEAVATLEAPPPSGNTEAAARTPAETAERGSPREEGSQTVAALLAKHAFENGVPLALAKAVVRIESRGNPRASNHGAMGLMQIKYGTARAVGFAGPAVALLVADINLRYGMKVLGQAYKAAGGDTCGALMRYQSGHYATHMNRANRAYCSRARALMAKV